MAYTCNPYGEPLPQLSWLTAAIPMENPCSSCTLTSGAADDARGGSAAGRDGSGGRMRPRAVLGYDTNGDGEAPAALRRFLNPNTLQPCIQSSAPQIYHLNQMDCVLGQGLRMRSTRTRTAPPTRSRLRNEPSAVRGLWQTPSLRQTPSRPWVARPRCSHFSHLCVLSSLLSSLLASLLAPLR